MSNTLRSMNLKFIRQCIRILDGLGMYRASWKVLGYLLKKEAIANIEASFE